MGGQPGERAMKFKTQQVVLTAAALVMVATAEPSVFAQPPGVGGGLPLVLPQSEFGKRLFRSRCSASNQARRTQFADQALASPDGIGAVFGSIAALGLSVCEQFLAYEAELAALESGEIGRGSRTEWESPDREGVTGATEVISAPPPSEDGAVCKTVRSIVYVDGEETSQDGQLCKAPGSTRWTRKIA